MHGRRLFNWFLTWVAREISLGTNILVLELILVVVRLRGVTMNISLKTTRMVHATPLIRHLKTFKFLNYAFKLTFLNF